MKIVIPLTALLMTSLALSAQPASVPTPVSPRIAIPGLPGVIEAVLQDFPDNFRHITGELLMAEGGSENYASTVRPPGAEACTITRYHSTADTTASWQARMYSSGDFGKASRIYHDLYRQLQSCYLLLPDSSMIFLQGRWEPAREDLSFTTSSLRLNTGDERYREMQIDLELLYQVTGWVININILTNRAGDEIGGVIQ